MKTERKRQLYAWVLLSVFVPAMALATLHVHESETSGNATCSACVNHQSHAGHLTSGIGHWHDCVLCQLLTTSFLVASTTLLPLLVPRHHCAPAVCTVLLPHRSGNTHGSRAPPAE
ncbi:MAG: hypothetical protein IJ739_04160 [Bacteroidaceae bacterium]|nr:hypothetical protein [Bacteroidaceae bacterium]